MIYFKEDIPIKLPGLSSIQVTFNYAANIVDAIKQLPNAIWHKKLSCWEIPATSLAKAIDMLSNYDDIDLTLLPNKVENQAVIEVDTSKYKTQPYQYQKEGIEYGLNHSKFLLLDAPGLGKTLQIIYLAQELKERENIEHCLIICGVNSLKHNWKREIEKHSNLSAKILGERQLRNGKMKIGSVADRVADLKAPIDEFFIITNIESLRSTDVVDAIRSGKNKIDMIAVDEVHHCFDYNTTITTSAGDLSIGDIVEQNIDCQVYSYNIETDSIELKPILNRYKTVVDRLILLELEDEAGNSFSLKCTPDHKIYTNNRGYVEAQNLLETDDIKSLFI